MAKESIYELQKIDCNCNDCKYLFRLLDKQNDILAESKVSDEEIFYIVKDRKAKYIQSTIESITKYKDFINDSEQKIQKQKNKLKLLLAKKYVYQGNKSPSQYGLCLKFDKQITFIPNSCQIETQNCFVHRKDEV